MKNLLYSLRFKRYHNTFTDYKRDSDYARYVTYSGYKRGDLERWRVGTTSIETLVTYINEPDCTVTCI